jgi:hypothetical protein
MKKHFVTNAVESVSVSPIQIVGVYVGEYPGTDRQGHQSTIAEEARAETKRQSIKLILGFAEPLTKLKRTDAHNG